VIGLDASSALALPMLRLSSAVDLKFLQSVGNSHRNFKSKDRMIIFKSRHVPRITPEAFPGICF
jgi:hypothetical protein